MLKHLSLFTLTVYRKVLNFCSNSVSCLLCSVFFCMILVATLIAAIAILFTAFNKVPGGVTCIAYNILDGDYIECGTGSSAYHRAELTQCPKEKDTQSFGVLNSWRIRTKHLTLYPQQLDPVLDSSVTSRQTHHLLNGWDIYEWKGSIIEGDCCITNLNNDTRKVYLYIFLNETYAYDFQDGNDAHHYLWSDQLNIPANRTSCFRKWGRNAPYTVEHNSYHFFEVDLPANVEFRSNITVLQMTVNVSDYPYSEPKWFSKENHPDISLPGNNIFYPVEYVIICGPPTQHSFSKLGTEKVVQRYQSDASMHVCTCKHPNDSLHAALLSIGILLFVPLVVVTIFVSVCCHKIYKCCRRRGYQGLP